MTDYKKEISVANTQDFNDMRKMLTEVEQKLIGIDPVEQTTMYRNVQDRIYELHENVTKECSTDIEC